ncbi:MAG: hypothetical protein IPK83_12550 [Planctomycetes bacterium]|nr:hypothetical protein [Planctomycetota bacterium]
MRPSTRKWLLLLAAGIVWFGASTRVRPLNSQREEHHLMMPPLPDEMASSMLATPLLAVGRALPVDYYWLRATKLKEEGRYFDALQLSQRICELQPKFAAVWAFQAWNMSYNISVTLKSPEERWRWVRNGYELLRDKGIPLNPNNTQLYRELAWILFHKVGDFMDDWHFYYKNQFAAQMQDILGEPHPGFLVAGKVIGDFYRDYDYKSLAGMPHRYDELLKDESVRKFQNEVAKFGFDVATNGIYLGLLKSIRDDKLKMPNVSEHEHENVRQAFLKVFNKPEFEESKLKLERFWRAHRLREEVKLDPQRIVELQQAFGVTFDFRLAETHALYWANLGMEMGVDKREALDIHKLNTNRIEFYCLQKMFHRGRLSMSRNYELGEPPLLEPDIRMIPPLFTAFINDSKQYKDMENNDQVVSENFRTGFVGFMRASILAYHELGMNKEADELFTYLKNSFPDPMYQYGIDNFLAQQMVPDQELDDYRVTTRRVLSLINRGLQNYAYDEDEQAVRYLSRAKQVFDRHIKHAVSVRLTPIPKQFDVLVTETAHTIGGWMPRDTYVHLCEKLKIEPLPEAPPESAAPATQPAG